MEAQSDKNFAHVVDDSEAKKCMFCGAETIGSDVCYKCEGNAERQKWLLRLKEINSKQQEHAEHNASETYFVDEEGCINLYSLANMIIYESPILTDKHTYLMYRFNGKIWVNDAEAYIQKRLVEAEENKYKPYHLTTLTQIIQGLTFAEPVEPEPNLICFENGVLDINAMMLKPHSKDYFFRNMIHAEYKPEAKAEAFLKWLNEVLPDADAQKTVQEMFGYCLFRDYPLHHLFFLVGSGRNGRSTLLRTLEALLGKENCASVPLELLPERFQTTNLIGKMVNVVSEPRSRKMLDTPILKKLTGGDSVEAEFKGKQKTTHFTNYAKIIVLANELPPVRDDSYGWWERVILIEFPVSIPEDKRISNIEHRWLSSSEERSGIINWALEGLKRILANDKFTKTEAMRNQIEQYKRWSNPAQYFLEKYCEYAPKLWITKKALYEAYKLICEEEGLQILSEEAFAKEVRKQPRVTFAKKRVEGKTERVWIGIQLKENRVSEACEAGEAGELYSAKVSEGNNNIESMENNIDTETLDSNKLHASHASPASEGIKSIGELLSEFLGQFPHDRAWTTVEFEMFMERRGLSRDEALRLLQQLKDEGMIFEAFADVWRWT
jgi:putative DNA primase/helicase